MLHCFKSAKQKLVYDTASGAVIHLTSLEYKMLQAITPPLAPLCPSSLRYELAKYDSADVGEAYDHLYALFCEGLLFAADHGEEAVLRIGEPYGLTQANEIARDVSSLLGGKSHKLAIQDGISPQVAEEIRAILCKNV